MKKINLIIIATFSLMAMALVSCNKDITLQEIEQESAGTISVSVDGIMGEYAQGNETKAGLVSTTRVSWSAGDKVYIYDGTSCLGELTVSLKDGKDYYAVLTGESINAPQDGTTKLTLVYSNATVSEISDGKVSVDISAQEGNTTPKDIPFVAFCTLDYTSGTPEISGQIADFSLATSLMRLNCSGLEANTAITEATLTGMSNECVLNITKDGVEIGQGNMGDIAVSFTDVSANAKGTQTLYAAVAKNGTTSNQTLEINQANMHTYGFGSKTREAGKVFNTICQMVKSQTNRYFTVDFEGKRVLFSQGNLWADGSNGLHFEDNQWGYNSEYDTDHVSHFRWSDNLDTAVEATYIIDFFPKYLFCDEKHKVSVDGSEQLYYALSIAEWQYLFLNHSCNWATLNGVGGYVLAPDGVTLPEGKTSYTETELNKANLVFLPVAGNRDEDEVAEDGIVGMYWSASLYNTTNQAYFVTFYSGRLDCSYIDEVTTGRAIRLVTNVK